MISAPRPAAGLFLLLALPAGLLLLVLTPPYQVPDEPGHLFRAFQLAEGRLLAEARDGMPGGTLPLSLVASADAFLPTQPAAPRAELLARLKAELSRPLAGSDRGFVPFASAAYSPVPYLPAVAAIAIGKAFSAPPLVLLYAGRLATLVAATLLHALALAVAPVFRRPLALLALLPMAAFLRSGLSADPVTNGLAFLFLALVLRLATREEYAPSSETRKLAVAASVALALCKGYALLLPLLLLVPQRAPGRRRLAWGAVVLGGTAALGWALAVRTLPVPPRLDAAVDPGAQLRTMTGSPEVFVSCLGRELAAHGLRYGRELVGQLGWLDVRLPVGVLLALAAALLVLVLADEHAGLRLARSWRLRTLSVLAVSALFVFGAMFVAWTPAGAAGIEGVQGRYFLPFAPPALFLLVSRRSRLPLSDRALATILILAVLLGLAASLVAMDARYVAPVPPAAGSG